MTAIVQTLRIDTGERIGVSPPITLAIDVLLPRGRAAEPKLVVCLPGGGVGRRYFDMAGRFSFAHSMVNAGHVVAMIDPPGVGDSDTIADPYALSVAAQLPVLARAIDRLREALPGSDIAELPAIGVGHSAGAMLVAALQHQASCFAGLMLLSFGTAGLPQHLGAEWLALWSVDPERAHGAIAEHARARFAQPYFSTKFRDGDKSESQALRLVMVPALAPVALQAMTPGNVAPELAAIDVPVFAALGERDMLGPPHLLGATYRSCPDFTQLVIPGAGHHIFLAPDTSNLFARAAGWLEDLVPSMPAHSASLPSRRSGT